MRNRKIANGLEFHKVRCSDGKMRHLPVGADPSLVVRPNAKYRFNEDTTKVIVQKYIEGLSIRKIAQMEGMPPYATIMQWMSKHTLFHDQIKEAKRLRGLYHEEEALHHAEDADEDNVQAQRLKVETHKWAAEISDPETYGKKTKLIGDPNQPIAFVINTGVPAPEEKVIELPKESK